MAGFSLSQLLKSGEMKEEYICTAFMFNVSDSEANMLLAGQIGGVDLSAASQPTVGVGAGDQSTGGGSYFVAQGTSAGTAGTSKEVTGGKVEEYTGGTIVVDLGMK